MTGAAPIAGIDAIACTIPTDLQESDGTLSWHVVQLAAMALKGDRPAGAT